MRKFRFLASALAVTGTLAIAGPAAAQSQAQPYQPQMAPTPTPDADALAEAMRQLASNPRDVTALITAGELSLKVGDASGAAALFKRAEQVDPMNGRIKAGMARILVTQERPGEALRYFDQAVGYGLDPRTFVGDRGLAYDLIGQQERAQRDYRLALKSGDNDEVRRRYALSLAISGNQLAAFEQLEPLTRRNDRAAWRARAFVLAMTGDVPGANKVAQGMMPPAMAQALAPFFTRLPTLAPADKAFAVHFGELTPTPQRLADARLTPVLAALGPDPDARPAIVVPSPPPQDSRARRGRRRSTPGRVEVASAAPRPAAAAPAPGFGAAGQSPTDPVLPAATAAPVRTAASAPLPAAKPVAQPPRPAPAPTQFARADVDPIQKATLADYGRVQRVNEERERQSQRAAQVAATKAAPTPSTQLAATPSAPTTLPVATTPPVAQPASSSVAVAAAPPSAMSTAPTTAVPAAGTQTAAATPSTTPPATQLAAIPAPTAITPTSPAASAATPAAQFAAATPTSATSASASPSSTPTPLAANEDSILARIVQGLTIPGAELGVAAPPQPAPVAPAPVVAANVEPRPATPNPPTPPAAREAAAKPPVVVATRAAAKTAPEPAARTRSTSAEVAEVAPSRRGARSRDTAAEEPSAPTTRSGRRGAATRTASTEAADTPATRTRSGRRTETRTAAKEEADDAAPTRGTRGSRAVAARDADAPTAKGKGRGANTRTAADKKAEKPAAEPSRIWVQVAGGANEGDLGKAYSAVQSRTPALKGRAAYSTPLRATNRVVTGPFKTDAEARAFVNQLAKQGVSAFPFTSEKGQKMTKIPPK